MDGSVFFDAFFNLSQTEPSFLYSFLVSLVPTLNWDTNF